jgi:eukaryotic-like serine/threonine-protein kinase
VTLAPGYRAVKLIRSGPPVSVYDAWSEARACRCVAKVAHGRATAQDRHALVTEGRRLLGLAHPHIVRAYEVRVRPRAVVILEALPGETLSRVLERRGRGLAARDLALLGVHLCSALQYLHRRGLLHLDLKPSNVVCQAGIARLIDLGIAQAPGRGRRGVGSAPYMAPEQARGETVTAATDVFGLGAVLFAAATRRAPFRSRDGAYEQLRRRAPSVRARRRLPAPLAGAIDGCLALEPALRPALAAVEQALRAALGQRAREKSAPRPRSRSSGMMPADLRT